MELSSTRTVRILSEDWRVIYQDLPSDDVRGYCDGVKRRIVLDPKTAGREDLLHEIMHAIEYCLNLDIDHQSLQAEARGLWSVFRENPWVLADVIEG